MIRICPFNYEVDCEQLKCGSCGWNPVVAKARVEEVMKNMTDSKLYKVPFTGYCEVWANSAEEAADKAETLSIGFWDLFLGGGWLMWVLVLLAAVMVYIFVERFIAIRKATTIDNDFMNRIRDYISEGNIGAAIDLCRRTDSPIARMVEKGIERIGRPMGDIQNSIENVANVEVAKLETGLPWLASISGGAPMIGFLGTVVGMVQVFIDMSANSSGGIEIQQLSAGMYVAMVTTIGGLIVGIPAYFAHNYLVARIEKLIFRMEATTIAFMDILNQPVQK